MNNSKLINVLRTFSKNEMKEFEKLVSSSFFNKGRNYVPFLKELNKFYPNFDNELLTPEYIHSRLYPGKHFNKQIIWNMTSGLLNLIEEFLVHSALKKNRFIKNNLLAGEYLSKKLEQIYLKTIDEMENAIDRPGINRNYFLYKVQLESARKEYFILQEKLRLSFEHDIKKGEYAIMYFLWHMVEVINDMKVGAYMYNTKYEMDLCGEMINNLNLEKFVDYCYGKNFSFAWFVEMCYCQIMMNIKPDGFNFFLRLKEIFEHNYNKFTEKEKFNWITTLMNYCSFRKDVETRKILFEIHKFELNEGIAFTDNYLSKSHFLQILKNAIAIDEVEWVKKFIDDIVPRLKPSLQKSMRSLGLAYYYFQIKDYENVIVNLNNTKFHDAKDKFAVKLMYIRTFYELNETETLFSFIDSALHFIDDNISLIKDDIARNYKICLKLIRKLLIAKEKDDQFAIEKIKKDTIKNKDLLLGDWLIEKIDELKEGGR